MRVGLFEGRLVWVWSGSFGAEEGGPGLKGWGVGWGWVGEEGDFWFVVGISGVAVVGGWSEAVFVVLWWEFGFVCCH